MKQEVTAMSKDSFPTAKAVIKGYGEFSNLRGKVLFYPINGMTLVCASVYGFPKNSSSFHGFHIHEGGSCTGNELSDTKGHYNPEDQPHPFHAGDLPPLLSCSGIAYMEVLTNRFTIENVLGKTVVIHRGADDFRSQPAGDSGEKIACGVIESVCKGRSDTEDDLD